MGPSKHDVRLGRLALAGVEDLMVQNLPVLTWFNVLASPSISLFVLDSLLP